MYRYTFKHNYYHVGYFKSLSSSRNTNTNSHYWYRWFIHFWFSVCDSMWQRECVNMYWDKEVSQKIYIHLNVVLCCAMLCFGMQSIIYKKRKKNPIWCGGRYRCLANKQSFLVEKLEPYIINLFFVKQQKNCSIFFLIWLTWCCLSYCTLLQSHMGALWCHTEVIYLHIISLWYNIVIFFLKFLFTCFSI